MKKDERIIFCGGIPVGSLPYSTKVKNEWRHTLLPLYAFMAWTATTLPFHHITAHYNTNYPNWGFCGPPQPLHPHSKTVLEITL